jgi:two-component sensor histidine kinase
LNGKSQGNGPDDEFQVVMDLVSHDILNINQSVLSAIELMTESSEADEKAKRHVRRAESQIRISTQIFESLKVLCLTQRTSKTPSELVDLNQAVKKAISDVADMFPDRQIRVDLEESEGKAVVAGGIIVHEALTNALMGVIRLDPSERASMKVRISGEEVQGVNHWVVRLDDERVAAPSTLGFETIGEVSTDSRTKMGRMAGLIMAKLMTEKLGGAFETGPSAKGSEFRVMFTGAEGV